MKCIWEGPLGNGGHLTRTQCFSSRDDKFHGYVSAMQCNAFVLSSEAFCNIIYLKLKYLEIAFVYNIRFNCSIYLKHCTKRGSPTAMLCTKFQNDRAIAKSVMGIEFKMRLGRISYIAQGPWLEYSSSRFIERYEYINLPLGTLLKNLITHTCKRNIQYKGAILHLDLAMWKSY